MVAVYMVGACMYWGTETADEAYTSEQFWLPEMSIYFHDN